MATDGLIGLTHDKMKVTAADQMDINILTNNTAIWNTLKTSNLNITVNGSVLTVKAGAVIYMRGRFVKVTKDIEMSFVYSSGLKFWIVFDEKLENTASGDVGTSTYTPVLNQVYFTFSNTAPSGVTEYFQLASINSETSFSWNPELIRNLHFGIGQIGNNAALGNNAILFEYNDSNSPTAIPWGYDGSYMGGSNKPGKLYRTADVPTSGDISTSNGVNLRYERAGSVVVLKFAGSSTKDWSFDTVIASVGGGDLDKYGIRPLNSYENWGSGEMGATSGGIKAVPYAIGDGIDIKWRGGNVSKGWADGSITYITKSDYK